MLLEVLGKRRFALRARLGLEGLAAAEKDDSKRLVGSVCCDWGDLSRIRDEWYQVKVRATWLTERGEGGGSGVREPGMGNGRPGQMRPPEEQLGELVSIRHCPRHLRTALDCSRPGQLVELLA